MHLHSSSANYYRKLLYSLLMKFDREDIWWNFNYLILRANIDGQKFWFPGTWRFSFAKTCSGIRRWVLSRTTSLRRFYWFNTRKSSELKFTSLEAKGSIEFFWYCWSPYWGIILGPNNYSPGNANIIRALRNSYKRIE
jgi:hypothetical protein